MQFVDETEIVVASGRGGDGCVSFRREAHVPRGGPDGGDGGDGGAIVLVASSRRNTLVDYRRRRVHRAPKGQPGRGRQMTGAAGSDLVLEVPVGTTIHDAESGELLADLDSEGERFTLPGGAGGRGNVNFKSSTRQTPRFATEGRPGTELTLRLELKLLADVGLLGFPNAGKSTLISRISAARPKIADYPFTTLVPNLGVVSLDPGDSFVVADIPGLIRGAAEGAGLGHQFLRHVERCDVYLHLVAADADEPIAERVRAIEDELAAYEETLLDRPRVLVLTKIDLLDEATIAEHLDTLRSLSDRPVHAISAVTGRGLPELVGAAWTLLRGVRGVE